MRPKNNAYSIVDESNNVLKSFYADGDADAYVDSYLHAERLGCATVEGPHCKLVHHHSVEQVYCPFSDDERAVLRLAAKFCSTMTTLASFRAMRTLATTTRVSERTGIRCAIAAKLFDEGYRARKPEKYRRRLEHVTGDFYLESDLTKTMLDFVDWMVTNEPS
jgi:hypothetical protein